ncbi:MAG: hypothetical protein R3E31_08600 [Chloroflexota bacterium]
MSRNIIVLFLICIFWLSACTHETAVPLPTRAEAVTLPTPLPPTATNLPPTRDLTPPTTTPLPTQPVATLPPPPTSIPVEPVINITAPDDGAQLILGSEIVARGLAQLDASHVISLTLRGANGHILSSTQGIPNEVGWEAGLSVPETVSGVGQLRASVLDSNGTVLAEDTTTVTLALDADNSEQYLALYNPTKDGTAVAGYFLFFDGRVRRPTGNTVTISLWMDNCQTEAAKFQITLGGSGYWQGSLGIPRDSVGAGCAIASFGTPGTDGWREAQIPITIYAADDPAASGVQITIPANNSEVSAGQELTLSGNAFNAALLTITIILDNGRIVAEQTAVPDTYGYWELLLTLPFDVTGSAEIRVTAQDKTGATIAETTSLIIINPAPTPTPGPTATVAPTATPGS